MIKQKLSAEEKEILDAFESGKLRTVPHLAIEKKRFHTIAKAHGLKNKRVSHKQEKIIQLFGTIDYDPKYDYKKERT